MSVKQDLAAVYAEIKRVDELGAAESRRIDDLGSAESRRIDGLLKAQETAVNAALAAAEKAVAAALAASEKAVNKAELAQGNVNETQNEFRGTLRDQAQTLMPRAEAENLIRELRGLLAAQADVIATMRSRLDVGPPSLGVLQARSDEQIGRRGGSRETFGDIRAIALVAFAAAGFVVAVLVALLKP